MQSTSSRIIDPSTLLVRDVIIYPGESDINFVTDVAVKFDKHYNSISMGEKMIRNLFASSLEGVPLSPEFEQGCISIITQKVIQIAKNFPHFTDLSSKSQQVLLKNNISMVMTLGIVECDSTGNFAEKIRKGLSPEDFELVMALIQEMVASQPMKSQFFEDQPVCSKSLSLSLRTDDQKTKERYEILESRVRNKVGFDSNATVLLTYLCLFCNDIYNEDIDPKERSVIENSKEEIACMLQRYLFASYPSNIALVNFTKAMETLIDLREMSDIMNNMRIE